MLVDERRIQAMYAFDYKRLVGVELENAPVFFAAARHKVENGHFCFFAGRKRYEIAPETGNVKSVYVLKILFAVFVGGYIVAVDVIVIKRQHYRVKAENTKLCSYPVCTCCFA